jgi:hypothetical protein
VAVRGVVPNNAAHCALLPRLCAERGRPAIGCVSGGGPSLPGAPSRLSGHYSRWGLCTANIGARVARHECQPNPGPTRGERRLTRNGRNWAAAQTSAAGRGRVSVARGLAVAAGSVLSRGHRRGLVARTLDRTKSLVRPGFSALG